MIHRLLPVTSRISVLYPSELMLGQVYAAQTRIVPRQVGATEDHAFFVLSLSSQPCEESSVINNI